MQILGLHTLQECLNAQCQKKMYRGTDLPLNQNSNLISCAWWIDSGVVQSCWGGDRKSLWRGFFVALRDWFPICQELSTVFLSCDYVGCLLRGTSICQQNIILILRICRLCYQGTSNVMGDRVYFVSVKFLFNSGPSRVTAGKISCPGNTT